MSEIDTSCRKCGAAMRPLPESKGNVIMDRFPMTITGYLCLCGHWNDLKRRKPKKITDK